MASVVGVRPPDGDRSWTVIGGDYSTVGPVEEWLEAHRDFWSPNTLRAYATGLAQWWSFLEHRGECWQEVGVTTFGAFLSWQRAGRLSDACLGAEAAVTPETLQSRLGALMSFYRWQEAVHDVPVAGRLLRGRPGSIRRGRGLLAHLDARSQRRPTNLVRVRGSTRDRTPLLLPSHIRAILDACACYDEVTGEWVGNLRDRFLFAFLAETGARLGEALGMRIADFVMGRGGTPYVTIEPREDNPNGARVKMMRPRRVYVSADLERLYADYLTHLAQRAAEEGHTVDLDGFLFVNLERAPLLAPMRETTVRAKVAALRRKGVGPQGWTPHWLRHTHASALLLAGVPDWVVSRRLGHAHVQTTVDLYGWVSEDEALRAAANWKTYTSGWRMSVDD